MLSLFSTMLVFGLAVAAPSITERHSHKKSVNVQVGDRPYFLINGLESGPLKKKLESCSEGPFKTSSFSIGHRGAPLQFPEHSLESYTAAARQGAGVIECDVAFTKDKKLVCRHSQCDLHTTTNILLVPALAAKCTQPFVPASPGVTASAKCCTSDLTVKEFKSLCARMDGTPNPAATSAANYLSTPAFRTDLYATCATLLTHAESIKFIDSLGLEFTPELKTPEVKMPFNGYTQAQYATDLINEYKKAGIHPSRVWPQSFLIDDIYFWIKNEPKFGKQAVYLDERVDTPEGYKNATASLPTLKKNGINIVAPAFFALTKLDSKDKIVPSEYAIAAKKVGLKIIAWSFERSGPLNTGGGYYYGYINKVITKDSDALKVLDVLIRKVGIFKMFSDWPATVTYYANCYGLK